MRSLIRRHAAWGALVLAAAAAGLLVREPAGADEAEGKKGEKPRFVKEVKMAPWERAAFSKLLGKSVTARDETPLALLTKGPNDYGHVAVEFDTIADAENFKLEGAHVYFRFDRFVNFFVKIGPDGDKVLKALDAVAGVAWHEQGMLQSLPPPPKSETVLSRDLSEPIVRGGVGSFTGKGVIVAIVDTGLDFRHPDFITTGPDGKPTSRLLYFWDTYADVKPDGETTTPPINGPDGKPFGRVYTRDELTAELRDPHGLLPAPDEDGHGTACAGIAAGNGRAKGGKYTGVAPDADLIAVRLGKTAAIEHALLLAAACDWLKKVAGERPLVVSVSFSSNASGHDGYTVEERELNAMFPPTSGQGRVLCIAAGNGREDGTHAAVTFAAKARAPTLSWSSVPSGVLQVYLEDADENDVKVESTGEDTIISYVHPLSKSLIVELPSVGLTSQLWLYTLSGKRLSGHAYIFVRNTPAGASFDKDLATPGFQIGTPGAALNAVTVGSYDFNDLFDQGGQTIRLPGSHGEALVLGGLSSYSTPGPLRKDKRIKPDITAPGRFFTAPAIPGLPAKIVDTSGKYRYFNGTSAATPYTAGVLALIFQAKPGYTVKEIKDLLQKHAVHDDSTKAVPNGDWGYGKLTRKAVEEMLKEAR